MAKTADKEPVTWISTSEVLKRFHPDNPREHRMEEGGDVQAIANSLLEVGFATTLTLQEEGYLLSGHGRTLAADFLRNQSEDWHSHRWEIWLSKSPDRKDIAHLHHPRFNPEYWNRVPVTVIKLDEATQKATLIRLNNVQKDGKDQPKKLAALLSQLPSLDLEQAGWDEANAKAFMSAFIVKKKEQPAELEESGTDFQDKQYFERPNATDYSGSSQALSGDDIDENSVHTHFGEDDEEYEDGEEWGDDETPTNYPTSFNAPEIAEVETEVGNWQADNVNYDSAIAESRAVLLMSYEQLERYKELAKLAGEKLGIDMVSESVKVWRPKCVIAALEYVATNAGLTLAAIASPVD